METSAVRPSKTSTERGSPGNAAAARDADGFPAFTHRASRVHEDFSRFFDALSKDAHPMPVCAAGVGALAPLANLRQPT